MIPLRSQSKRKNHTNNDKTPNNTKTIVHADPQGWGLLEVKLFLLFAGSRKSAYPLLLLLLLLLLSLLFKLSTLAIPSLLLAFPALAFQTSRPVPVLCYCPDGCVHRGAPFTPFCRCVRSQQQHLFVVLATTTSVVIAVNEQSERVGPSAQVAGCEFRGQSIVQLFVRHHRFQAPSQIDGAHRLKTRLKSLI